MDLGLKGRRALVTGASTGLGFAAALALANEGAELVINSSSSEKIEKAADTIEKACGKRPATVAADLSFSDDIKSILAAAGKIDIFVSNGGGPTPGRLDDLNDEDWYAGGNAVLHSARMLTEGLIGSMKSNGWGRLIYITSVAVKQPVDDLLLSNVYRAGLTAFSKTISNTYAMHGITANTVCPGYTQTGRLVELAEKRAIDSGRTTEELLADFSTMIPAGRLGQPDELAALITFLASDKAAYITGTTIPVDGGAIKSLL